VTKNFNFGLNPSKLFLEFKVMPFSDEENIINHALKSLDIIICEKLLRNKALTLPIAYEIFTVNEIFTFRSKIYESQMVTPSTFSASRISSSIHLHIKKYMELFYIGPGREFEFILNAQICYDEINNLRRLFI